MKFPPVGRPFLRSYWSPVWLCISRWQNRASEAAAETQKFFAPIHKRSPPASPGLPPAMQRCDRLWIAAGGRGQKTGAEAGFGDGQNSNPAKRR